MKWMIRKKKESFVILFSCLFLFFGCKNPDGTEGIIDRFEQDLFNLSGAQSTEDFSILNNDYPDFFPLYCSEIIGVGPDTSLMLPVYLNQFLSDPVIISIKETIDSVFPDLSYPGKQIQQAISRFNKLFSSEDTIQLVSYLSGFNQSFVSLPGILGIGLDNYLGSEITYYQQLAIPKYIRKTMAPEFLAVDAVRAWILSEIPDPKDMSSLLDHMIYEGKLLFLLHESFPGEDEHRIFRFTREQMEWCREYEKSMWEFIVENELLYSTERLLIKRFTKEAPFIKEFGQESPGRGVRWLGFRKVSRYIQKTGKSASEVMQTQDARTILSESRYRPG